MDAIAHLKFENDIIRKRFLSFEEFSARRRSRLLVKKTGGCTAQFNMFCGLLLNIFFSNSTPYMTVRTLYTINQQNSICIWFEQPKSNKECRLLYLIKAYFIPFYSYTFCSPKLFSFTESSQNHRARCSILIFD